MRRLVHKIRIGGARWPICAFAGLLALLQPIALSAQGALGGRNTDQPIEIDADRLDVQQAKQMAIFSGNVDAVQGSMRLRADTLQVHYRKRGDGGPPGATPDAAGISQIDAIGRVLVTSPEETAQGDRGFYFVDRRVIVIEGNVALTRGGNVIKGQRATMDFDTGRAIMDQGRVRGVFTPSGRLKPAP